MRRPQNNLNLTPTLRIAYFFAPKSQKEITLKLDKIISKNWWRQRKHMLFFYKQWLDIFLQHIQLGNKRYPFLKDIKDIKDKDMLRIRIKIN